MHVKIFTLYIYILYLYIIETLYVLFVKKKNTEFYKYVVDFL